MASQGKSKRRTKGKTMDLQTFINDTQGNAPEGYTFVHTLDWADCMENEDFDDTFIDSRRDSSANKVILPTVPKSARTPDFDVSKVPTRSPFKAYLGNLPYDVTEDEIHRFFQKLKITNVQLVKDTRDRNRPKGIGYVEFEDRENLIEALQQNGESIKNRSIRVSLSENNDVERPKREEREDRTASDWRSGPRDESSRPRAPRGMQTMSRNGSDYTPSDPEPYRGRGSYDRNDRRGQDFSRNNRDNYRSNRNFRDESNFDDQRNYDRYRNNRYDGPTNRREFGSGFERKNYSQSQRYSPSPPVLSSDNSLGKESNNEPPKERQKLVLKPRTKPLNVDINEPASNSAIFGGAKPVDTAAREREIEEKLKKEKEKEEESIHSDTRSSSSSGLSQSGRTASKTPSRSSRHSDSKDE